MEALPYFSGGINLEGATKIEVGARLRGEGTIYERSHQIIMKALANIWGRYHKFRGALLNGDGRY